MSGRLRRRFAALGEQHRCALVPFITAGDPSPQATCDLMHALVEGGADVLELGVPFSDPMADGPVIQRANQRALAAGMTLPRVLEIVEGFRRDDAETPIVLMGYLNPFEQYGYQAFADTAARVGVDGVITVDLPAEADAELGGALRAAGVDPVYLLAPTSPPARVRRALERATGFIYYVSVKGVTGSAALDTATLERAVRAVRAQGGLPVGVGFGIRDGASAGRIARFADAVIVGSVLVAEVERAAEEGHPPEWLQGRLRELAAELRGGIDQARKETAE